MLQGSQCLLWLLGLLMPGVRATSTGTSGRLQFQRGDSAQRAALLLGTSVEDLHRAVFAHEALLSAGGNSRLASR